MSDPLTIQLVALGGVVLVGLALAWAYASSPERFEKLLKAFLFWDDDRSSHPDDRE